MGKDYYSLMDIAWMYGMNIETVRRWVKSERGVKLPSIQEEHTGKYLVKRDDLEEYASVRDLVKVRDVS